MKEDIIKPDASKTFENNDDSPLSNGTSQFDKKRRTTKSSKTTVKRKMQDESDLDKNTLKDDDFDDNPTKKSRKDKLNRTDVESIETERRKW